MFDHQEELDQYLENIEALIKNKQYARLRDLFLPMEPADIALLLEEAGEEQMPLLYRLLPKELAAEVFVELESDSQEMLINGFSNTELKEVLDELYLDDAVDIVEEMPASVVIRILDKATPEMRKSINEILQYPEDSAGSIMNMEFLSLKKDMTVEDAFKRIRRIGGELETINILYVTDPTRHLLGVLSVRDLLLAEEDDLIQDIMDPNVVSVNTMDDKEDVAQALSKYDFLAMPVVDKEQRLVGIVTVDDAMDVIEEETTEDFEKMAAMLPSDKPYLKSGIFATWRARLPWLMVLMLSATFTGMILNHYESALAACLVLNSYIPMLSGTGGNSGTQASVAVIRALSLDVVDFSDIFPGAVEGAASVAAVRRVPGRGQLRENAAGGPAAAGQRRRHAYGVPGGVPDHPVCGGVCQVRGLLPAHPGREDRPGPGGDGQSLHLHHRGRHQPADLFPLRLLVPAVAAYRKRRRSPASFYLQLPGLIQLGFAAVTGGGCGVGCDLLRRQGAADLAGSAHDHGPVGDHGPLGH